jgi:hypothetical protein
VAVADIVCSAWIPASKCFVSGGVLLHVGAKQLGVVFSGRFRSAFWFFSSFFWRFEKVFQVMGEIDLDQDRRVNETRCPEIAWN